MDKSLILKRVGGKVRLPRKTINFRVQNYSQQKLSMPLDKIPPDARQDIIFALHNFWDYSPKELTELLGVARATVYRDIRDGEFVIQRVKKRQYHVERIVDYIIYNMRYTPL